MGKEAKVGVTYRHDAKGNAPIPKTSRYVAIVNGLGEFAPVLEKPAPAFAVGPPALRRRSSEDLPEQRRERL